VLGWGRPIGDDVATLSAACLYLDIDTKI
jgi:hypothetical protein